MRFTAGTDLTFEIALIDAEGNSVDATAITYTVTDGDGAALTGPTSLAGYTAGSDAVVTVPAALNTLTGTATKAAREIYLICTTATGKSVVTKSYMIEAATGQLVRGVNTILTIASADMLATDMLDTEDWFSATRMQKTNALIEAYRRLCMVRLTGLRYGMASAYDQPAQMTRIDRAFISLADLSVAEVLGMYPKVLAALSYAQVAEATVILTGSDDDRRRSGLVLETVGEVKQMYRNGKPIELPISRKALSYISAYANFSAKAIGRT